MSKWEIGYHKVKKGLTLTASIFSIQLLLVITSACLSESAFNDPFGGCPRSQNADAIDISVFYSPFRNTVYASPTDTVNIEEFAFNFELIPELTSSANTGSLPGQAFALSCLPSFNFNNISNISVILKAPFNGLPTGTDISYLLWLPNETSLDDLRDFENTASFFTMSLRVVPENFAQLDTQTILFLRDGSQIVTETTSPVLRTNS